MTTFEQALREAYGDVAAWERERHGSAQAAVNERHRPTPREVQRRPVDSYRNRSSRRRP